MRMLRKLLTVLLVISLLAGMMMPAFSATAEKTTQEKAQILNALKMISGVNGDYSLNNKVRRAEAITFIVKLIGKGNEVETRKDFYKLTPFTDVPSTQWFAPFVGFGVSYGYIPSTSKEFKPLDYISQKDFLRYVLIALGYRENIDFTADTLIYFAIEKGVLSINDYVSNPNALPTRGSVVNILFTALRMNAREGGQLCLKLIDAGLATRQQLTAWGLIVDSVPSAISSVSLTDLDTLQLTMNEAVASVSGVRVYARLNETVSVPASVSSVSGNKVVVKVSPMEIGKEYILELTDVYDQEGNVTAKVTKNYTGSVPSDVVSDFFRIRKIEPVSQKSLKVYFTHPVSVNNEVCLYYAILKDSTVVAEGKLGQLKAGMLNSDKSGILLSLSNVTLNKGDIYTLKIDGAMMSAYGAKLNDGAGDTMKFTARDDTAVKFALNEVSALDKKTLLLSFNKEINPFLAQQIYNFYATDSANRPIRIASTAVDANGTAVYLNLGQDLEKGLKYNLTINNLNDVTKQEYITEQTYPFTANYGTSAKFEMTGLHITDSQTFEVYVNKALDPTEANKVENCYLLRAGVFIRPERVVYDPQKNAGMMTIYLSAANALSSRYVYEINLSGMKDQLGNSLEAAKTSFTGMDVPKADIKFENVVPISSGAVKVTFTRDIAFNQTNLSASNYALDYTYNNISIRKIPVGILYVDGKTLILKFDSLDYNTAYLLKAASLQEQTGTLVRNLEKGFELKK